MYIEKIMIIYILAGCSESNSVGLSIHYFHITHQFLSKQHCLCVNENNDIVSNYPPFELFYYFHVEKGPLPSSY